MKAFLLLSHLVLAAAVVTAGRGQTLTGVDELVAAVGERVGEFYARAKSVICTEVSTVQPIDSSHSPQGFARTVESELRVENRDDAVGEAAMVRKVRKVNGRPPRDQDKTDRAGCAIQTRFLRNLWRSCSRRTASTPVQDHGDDEGPEQDRHHDRFRVGQSPEPCRADRRCDRAR
jgi:hypothetical protein